MLGALLVAGCVSQAGASQAGGQAAAITGDELDSGLDELNTTDAELADPNLDFDVSFE